MLRARPGGGARLANPVPGVPPALGHVRAMCPKRPQFCFHRISRMGEIKRKFHLRSTSGYRCFVLSSSDIRLECDQLHRTNSIVLQRPIVETGKPTIHGLAAGNCSKAFAPTSNSQQYDQLYTH